MAITLAPNEPVTGTKKDVLKLLYNPPEDPRALEQRVFDFYRRRASGGRILDSSLTGEAAEQIVAFSHAVKVAAYLRDQLIEMLDLEEYEDEEDEEETT